MSSTLTRSLSSRLTARLNSRDVRLANFKYFEVLVNVFVVVLLISNLVGSKIVDFGSISLFGTTLPIRVSGAQMLFPITYIFGDIFTEVYGYAGSRRAIWIGFFASGLMAIMAKIIVLMPAAPGWEGQLAYATVFNFVPRVVIASLCAFWAGEFVNSYVMAKMKLITDGRYLWTRTVGSTVAGQAVDTTIVIFLTFAGSTTLRDMGILIASGSFGKVIYEAAA